MNQMFITNHMRSTRERNVTRVCDSVHGVGWVTWHLLQATDLSNKSILPTMCSSDNMMFITDHVRSRRELNVFTCECDSVHKGVKGG